ncbi:hypothetical protein [Plantactinospora sp. GCM10030261]|uniref:hypothetical protein n=1 Tax=Plantactinospora sp. GCM10030261 TaxID=3273420 RepID=UPI00361FB875
MSGARTAALRRELLVRYLDVWLPRALNRSRRLTVALGYAGVDRDVADASLAALAEFADRFAGRRVTVVVLAPDPGLAERLATAQRRLGLPADVAVHPIAAGPDVLPAALRAAGAAGAPLLAYLDLTDAPVSLDPLLAAVAAGRPAEALLVLGGAAADAAPTAAAGRAGFTLCTEVELVPDDATAAERLVFATSHGRNLDAFKDELWALDEYAGVRYRDPRDPEGHLLDITLNPHPGPLRRELLARLDEGPATVTELRQFAASQTVYRAADVTRVLGALLAAGSVSRAPEGGRLGGDVVISREVTSPGGRRPA